MPRRPTRRPQARAPRWALVTRLHPELGPCWAITRPGLIVWVGPAQGPAAHVYRAQAERARAHLAQFGSSRRTR